MTWLRPIDRILFTAAFVIVGPSALVAADLDLTSRGASGAFGGVLFLQSDPQPTGSGVIDPFVRLARNGSEQGFNTDHTPLDGDLADVKPGTWTHSLRVGALTSVLHEGMMYKRFLLDINQTNANPHLSLDALALYTSPNPALDSNAALFAANLVYDMGAGNRVLLDYDLNAGSGSGDLFLYVPEWLLAGLEDQYLYLYSVFGASGGDYASNDGFEEWAHIMLVLPVANQTWSAMKGMYR